MKEYSIAIVEDEEAYATQLSEFLSTFAKEEGFQLSIKRFSSAVEAIETYKGQFDIFYLDIQMPGMSGMDFAREVRKVDEHVMLIFVTSLAQYALEGYEVMATDYIVKPIVYPEFKIKMKRAFSKLPEKEETVIRFVSSAGFYVVPIDDVLYCETDGHSVVYHCKNGDYRKHQSMKEAEKDLEPLGFLRINSCYLVATKRIEAMEGHFVVLNNGERLLVSRPRLQTVTQFLRQGQGDDK